MLWHFIYKGISNYPISTEISWFWKLNDLFLRAGKKVDRRFRKLNDLFFKGGKKSNLHEFKGGKKSSPASLFFPGFHGTPGKKVKYFSWVFHCQKWNNVVKREKTQLIYNICSFIFIPLAKTSLWYSDLNQQPL